MTSRVKQLHLPQSLLCLNVYQQEQHVSLLDSSLVRNQSIHHSAAFVHAPDTLNTFSNSFALP